MWQWCCADRATVTPARTTPRVIAAQRIVEHLLDLGPGVHQATAHAVRFDAVAAGQERWPAGRPREKKVRAPGGVMRSRALAQRLPSAIVGLMGRRTLSAPPLHLRDSGSGVGSGGFPCGAVTPANRPIR